MSDTEGATKKSGYRLEYASSARAKCKGTKPCAGTPIPKGALRLGSIVDFRGNTSFAWRHWGCTTPKIISNMQAKFNDPEDLDGFDDLKEEDQERVRRAWTDGHVADEDIPPTARKPADAADEEEEKPKKKRAPAKKKAEAKGDAEEKPKKKRATKPKKTEEEVEDEDEAEESVPVKKPRSKKRETEENGEKPKAARRQPAAKKAPPKKKAAKVESELSGEDFADELAGVEDEDEEDGEDESAGKKRKRPASTKQAPAAKKPRGVTRVKKTKAVIEEDYDDE